MEYRMKYRDIPWSVALTLLPGKIIGTLFIKPPIYLRRNFNRLLRKYGPPIIICIMALMIFLAVFMIIDYTIGGGQAAARIKHIFLSTPEIIAP